MDKFGGITLEVIDNETARLAEVEGVGRGRLKMIETGGNQKSACHCSQKY
jgi:hypothetical protein